MKEALSMDRIILDPIPFEVDGKGLSELLRVKPGSRNESLFLKILDEARTLGRPKAVFAAVQARLLANGAVDMGGVIFTSRILSTNLEKSALVFPYAATCGTELEDWAQGMGCMLQAFWADSIMLMALGCAVSRLEQVLKDRLGQGVILSSMNPGSLEDWPLGEQVPLFSLLGDSAAAIGITLSDKMVLRPLKSVSGIQFFSEEGFVNCSLCPRQDCQSRRAAYDPTLLKGKFSHCPESVK
jgi:hypothetical protein